MQNRGNVVMKLLQYCYNYVTIFGGFGFNLKDMLCKLHQCIAAFLIMTKEVHA